MDTSTKLQSPKLAVIGGSGAYHLAKIIWGKHEKPEIIQTPQR